MFLNHNHLKEAVLQCDGAANGADCHALVMWFDADFSDRVCKESPVTLTTSPHAPPTHWAQTVLTLRTPVYLHGDGAHLSAALAHERSSTVPLFEMIACNIPYYVSRILSLLL